MLARLAHDEPELFGDKEDLAILFAALDSRQSALRDEALEASASVFADDPAEESRTIGLLWLDAAAAAQTDVEEAA